MSRRIIPVLCALAVAVVPATALAQPAHDPSPVITRGGVVYGDTKYDLQNQQDQKAPTGVTAYEQAISGDTKGQLPRAIAPVPGQTGKPIPGVTGMPVPAETGAPVTDLDRVGSLSAAQLAAAYGTTKPKASPVATTAPDDSTNGWQLAAVIEAGLLAAFAIAAAVFFAGRQTRAPRLGV
jgi:hypothetical protein